MMELKANLCETVKYTVTVSGDYSQTFVFEVTNGLVNCISWFDTINGRQMVVPNLTLRAILAAIKQFGWKLET